MSLLGFNIWTRGRGGPKLSHWSTHLYPTWFRAKHSLDNWCPTLCPGPFSDHRYQPKGLLQLLESFTCLLHNAAGQRARKQMLSEMISSSQWQVGMARKHPSCSVSGQSYRAICSLWLQESPTDTKIQWFQELLVWQCVFHQFTPPSSPGHFPTTFCLSTAVFLMFLSGICFSGSSNLGKNQRKAGGCENSAHKSKHPTSGPHPIF